MLFTRCLRFAAAAAAITALSPSVDAAELYRYVPAAKSARAPEMLASPVAVEMDFAALVAAGPGATLDAALPNGKRVTIRIERTERHDNGDVSWTGKVLDLVRGDLAATGTTGAAGTYAELETSEGTWGIVPSTEGHEWLFDKTAAQLNLPLPQRADDTRVPPVQELEARPKAICPIPTGTPTPQVTIDVLAVLAPDFVSRHGGAGGAETRLNSMFTNLNAYNTASNIAITYRRVATINANYQAASTPNDDDGDALDAITTGMGSFANVAAIRNFFGADMVALFRGPKNTSGNSIAGIAWVNGDTNGNMPASAANYMYSVIGDWTFPGATLAAHEMGHNLGNNHDRPNAPTVPSGTTPHSYGHYVCGTGADAACGTAGFNNTGTGFGTIMAYHRPTVAKFANPSLTCQGTQPGAVAGPCGIANLQDDARATNCVRQTVAGFRSSWVGTCADLAADADNDGIPNCLEAGSGRVSGVRDNDIFTNSLLFSAQQYRDFLAREPDADGLHFWTGALTAGNPTRAQMAESFFNSAEFQGVIAPVARLYFAYFLRIPDYTGLQFWIGQYRSGMPLAQISQAFAGSAEFAARYGALNNTQFVTLVYQNVLSRAPDGAGLAYWVGQLDLGALDRGAVMLAFSESAEYRGIIGNEIYVTMMYIGMLRRAPETSGFDFWVNYLDTGNSGLALINGFLTAPEYRSRFLP